MFVRYQIVKERNARINATGCEADGMETDDGIEDVVNRVAHFLSR